MLTVGKMRKALVAHEQVIRRALTALFPSPDEPLSLDAIAMGVEEEDGEDLADMLLATLNQFGKVPHFISYLRARGADPVPLPRDRIFARNIARFTGIEIGEPLHPSFDLGALGDFAARAEAFRCRITLDDAAEGSGAFVAPNLVLTASHVLDRLFAPRADDSPAPRLGIIASDGERYPATCVQRWPYHDGEVNGALPPDGMAQTHVDIALLRVFMPLGQAYGCIDVSADPPDFVGPSMFTLVHYPEGRETGFVSGRVRRDGPGASRLPHDIDTAGGSSGGPGFDRDLRFLGIHQGRWQNVRRLVPYERFRDEPRFRALIEENSKLRFLWSLDRNIEGPLIIGRRQFNTGLAAMLEKPTSRLRGIWIRREDTNSIRGLGFSYDMLEAYLLLHERPDAVLPHRCIRISPSLRTTDLLADLAQLALEDDLGPEALPGTGDGQTTDVAHQESRADALMQAMQRRAEAKGQTWWVFFDNPPNGLSPDVQVQLEHVARHLPTRANLRLILAGYETYRLAPLRFGNVAEADTARRAGLLVEELGPFTRSDVEATINAMITSLSPETELRPARLQEMTEMSLQGLVADATGEFSGNDLGTVAAQLRRQVKAFLGVDA